MDESKWIHLSPVRDDSTGDWIGEVQYGNYTTFYVVTPQDLIEFGTRFWEVFAYRRTVAIQQIRQLVIGDPINPKDKIKSLLN